MGGEVRDVPCTATWRQGEWRVTVTSPGGGEQPYDVIGSGDRPSRGWFIGTPWAIFPGADWEEQDGRDGETPVWTVAVFLESPDETQKLTNDCGFVTS